MTAAVRIAAAAVSAAAVCGGVQAEVSAGKSVAAAVSVPLHPGIEAVSEILPLALEAVKIQQRSLEREERHRKELAAKGIAEVPACGSERYAVDMAGLSAFSFDEWGEFYIDRRFVTDEEMKTVRAIEKWIRKWFPGKARKSTRPRSHAGAGGMPVFRGFEAARYQKHDRLILEMTKLFNANKAKWCGGTKAQSAKIPDLSPALVKSHMIEESGGNGKSSRAAWEKDPLQVNVPGDWGDEKILVGLSRPEKRNEGTLEGNVRAAMMDRARTGFGTSAKPAAARPSAVFACWLAALRRYNGRRDRTDTDRYYSHEYADKILRRASNPETFVPIEIKLKK